MKTEEMSVAEITAMIKILISQKIPECESSYFLRKLIFSTSTWDVYVVFYLLLEQFPDLHVDKDVKK